MPRISWICTGSTYRRMEGDITNLDIIPNGIYEVCCDLTGWYLVRTADSFIFNYKVYDLQRGFIDHVKKTYENTSGNLGVLFNGTRGTGKTVSAKVLANELNLPIVLVKSMGENNDGLISYLSSFNFDCIFFFDEFEKQFHEGDCSILQIMDGVYNSEYRKVFLLTTNELTINENLLSRPSRIRYVREFGNLEREVVEEYLDDNLKDVSGREDLLSYIDTLTISTIDILKAIVEEVNIHGIEAFLEIKKIFNVTIASYNYRTIRGYVSVESATNKEYGVNNFLTDVKNYKNRYDIRESYNRELEDAKTEEEHDAISAKYRPLLRYGSDLNYDYVDDEDKAWNRLVEKRDLFNNEMVIKVFLEQHVVITRYGDSFYFYYIENPEQKPSLYNESKSINQNYDYLL